MALFTWCIRQFIQHMLYSFQHRSCDNSVLGCVSITWAPWHMLTSWHGNVFHMIAPSVMRIHRSQADSPHKRPVIQDFCFLCCWPRQTWINGRVAVIWDVMALMWRHCTERRANSCDTAWNGACRPGGRYWDYKSGTLSFKYPTDATKWRSAQPNNTCWFLMKPNIDQNTNIFWQENALQSVVSDIFAIFFLPVLTVF